MILLLFCILLAVIVTLFYTFRKPKGKSNSRRPTVSVAPKTQHKVVNPSPNNIKFDAARPKAIAVEASLHGVKNYLFAKELASSLFNFPYQSPSDAPSVVRSDAELMCILNDAYPTTLAADGSKQQTTISAADRIRLQGVFKSKIFSLLDTCLTEDKEFFPAALLYAEIAEFNTRAGDRERLIHIHERFLTVVESASKKSPVYAFMQNEIKNFGGNCFNKVERYLADFHYRLAVLYQKADRLGDAKKQYRKAIKCCPEIYGVEDKKIKLA